MFQCSYGGVETNPMRVEQRAGQPDVNGELAGQDGYIKEQGDDSLDDERRESE